MSGRNVHPWLLILALLAAWAGPATAQSAPSELPPWLQAAFGVDAATVHVVDSLDALQSRISDAQPGDVVVLRNGSYLAQGPLSIRRRGAEGKPIIVAAETIGGAEIGGPYGVAVTAPATQVIIAGFRFTHAAGKATIGPGTTQVRFSRNVFRCAGEGPYLAVAGDDARLDANAFLDKTTSGSMVAVGGTGGQVARRLRVHHNHFSGLSGGGASAEMLRMGVSAQAGSRGDAIVEHNLFAGCRGEHDLVSNRSSGNVYRYNTFEDSPTAQVSLRHGNECVVHGNLLFGTEGLRVFGDRHRIHSNVFVGNYIGLHLGNGDGESVEGAPAVHDRPDDCEIVFNTFVDNRTHYQMSRRVPGGQGAARTTFANNVLQGGVGAKLEGPYEGGRWEGNVLWNAADAGDLPPGAYTKEDPRLAADPDGIPRPAAGSPLPGTASGAYPFVDVDLDGQARPEPRSRGADEPAEAAPRSPRLTPADVGPNSPFAGVPPAP
jgi:poly(beta-D-mannuronate) lyase